MIHPLNTATSLIDIIQNPAESAVAFAHAINASCSANLAGCLGTAVFTIASMAIPGVGEDELAEEAEGLRSL